MLREKYISFYEERGKICVFKGLMAVNVSLSGNAFSLFFFFLKGRKEWAITRSTKLESGFQDRLVKEIKEDILPGCMVFKMDQVQGIPDLLILYKDKWASLECKKNSRASRRPNQNYYVELMNEMSFSRFIFPENKKEVLNELQQAFGI